MKCILMKTLKLSLSTLHSILFITVCVHMCTRCEGRGGGGGGRHACAYKWMSDENFLESEPMGSRDQTQVISLPLHSLGHLKWPVKHQCIWVIIPMPSSSFSFCFVVSSSGYLFHNFIWTHLSLSTDKLNKAPAKNSADQETKCSSDTMQLVIAISKFWASNRDIKIPISKSSTWEAMADRTLCVQDQSGLWSKSQTSHSYTVRPCI